MVLRFAGLILTLVLVTGCGPRPQPRQSGLKQVFIGTPVAIPTDDLGRAVTLKGVPRRVVTIGPGATEIIFALGAGERLVGRDSSSDYPPQALKAPVVANFTGPFFEKVVAVRPDLIIVQGETWDKARVEAWQQKCGAPVAALTANNLEEVSRSTEKIGAWLDLRARARALAQRMAASARLNHTLQARAFFEVSRTPLWTAGRGTLIDNVMGTAGLANVAREIKGYKQVNLEVLVAQEPEVYVVAAKYPDRERVLSELRRHPTLRNLKCIRKGQVFVVHADHVLRPGPRLSQGIGELFHQLRTLRSAEVRRVEQEMNRPFNRMQRPAQDDGRNRS